MIEPTRHIRYFLFSQYLADGVRITGAIILPTLICSHFGLLNIGLIISTGALCVSIADAPGPLLHRFNGMLYCNGFVFLMAMLTGFVNQWMILLGLLIVLAAFFFTMLAIYGTRAAALGIAALLIMILRMDTILPAKAVFTESFLILGGGMWYMMISLLIYRVRPYRQAQRSLGNCIHETSRLLLIKAALYDTDTNVKETYQKMLNRQVIVSESQDEVRELLFKSEEIVKDTNAAGQLLLITFIDVIDLYEQVTATSYDYHLLRARFAATGILPKISTLIREIAYELDKAGLAIQSNIPYKIQLELIPALNDLKAKIDAAKIENRSNLVLIKLLINIRNLGDRVNAISNYFTPDLKVNKKTQHAIDVTKFISHQEISLTVFRNNLSLDSSVFRHALRMMITAVLGFVIVQLISYGHHSYWILLTIVFIMKPGYTISKQRNIQRIAGTIAGGILGMLLIATIKDPVALFVLIVFFMIGTYTFQRLNYIITVLFMTPYILLLFNFLGWGYIGIVEERVLDTAIASLLAFVASYFLFPHWESKQLEAYMAGLLKANISYLQKLKNYFCGKEGTQLEYKLARKDLYVSTANLSAAFNRMLSEPKKKQHKASEIKDFVVLNNVLSSNIAGMLTSKVSGDHPVFAKELVQPLNRALTRLEDTLQLLDKSYHPGIHDSPNSTGQLNGILPDQHVKEHVGFIYKLAVDIQKVVKRISE